MTRIDRLALVGEGGVSTDNECAGDARKICCQTLGDAIDEVVLPLVATDMAKGITTMESRSAGTRLPRTGKTEQKRLTERTRLEN